MSIVYKTIDLASNPTLQERFEDKYVVSPCSCWIWTGATTRGGYGHIRAYYPEGHKMTRASRVSYALYKDFDKNEHLMVCHKCDNPLCVNPDHLFLGTSEDNAQDKVNKGRHNYGISGKIERDTALLIRKIANDPKRTKSQKEIGEDFGLKPTAISLIANNLRWVE